MKKYFLILILISFILSGCFFENEVIPNDNYIKFSFPEEFRKYLPYDEVPEFVLQFDGTIYTNTSASTTNKKVFNKNDDFYLSDVIASLLSDYEGRVYYRALSKSTAAETKMNNLVTDKNGNLKHETRIIPVSDGEIYIELAYLRLENGLLLSLEYRRFKSDFTGTEKIYYSWPKTRSLNAVLHYPLLLHQKADSDKELLLVPLPDKVIYRLGIGEQLPLATILKDKSFLGDFYKSYPYPDFNVDPRASDVFDLEENIAKVKSFYITYHHGRYEGEDFYFTYLEKDFIVTFNNENFMIDYRSF
ncbi:MAG: hypothetical protein M0R05_01155 [Bacilli bacterium]|nr:hypothetical protein [Bacilli bacterium]MDD4076737.1 hypothetical protein [Bacilli bacterium]MDD4387833.1 hypothetical protein [Bacilli bacterium]